MINIADLIAMLEKSNGGSRELDGIVARYLGNNEVDTFGRTTAPCYTTSLDAALTLVPKENEFEVGSARLVSTFWASVISNSAHIAKGAATAPLALCVAALRARGVA